MHLDNRESKVVIDEEPLLFLNRMACFYLEEYQTARMAFEAGQSLDPKASGFKTWINKCDAKLRGTIHHPRRCYEDFDLFMKDREWKK